jgi:hypothetical protein
MTDDLHNTSLFLIYTGINLSLYLLNHHTITAWNSFVFTYLNHVWMFMTVYVYHISIVTPRYLTKK